MSWVLTSSPSIPAVAVILFQRNLPKNTGWDGNPTGARSTGDPFRHHKALPHATHRIEFPLVRGNELFPASPVYLAKPLPSSPLPRLPH